MEEEVVLISMEKESITPLMLLVAIQVGLSTTWTEMTHIWPVYIEALGMTPETPIAMEPR